MCSIYVSGVVRTSFQMEMPILVILREYSLMAMVSILGQMEQFMRVSGKKEK